MKTLGDVYKFLCSYEEDLKDWIQTHPNKERLHEAVFVIFATKGLIPAVSNYAPCKGNFGTATITELNSVDELFEESIFRGGDGGSDYTAIDRKSKSIMGTTAKYLTNFTYEDLDIDKLVAAFAAVYQDFEHKRVCIVIPDRHDFDVMRRNIHRTTGSRANGWLDDAIVVDHDDLEAAFRRFKMHEADVKCVSSSLRPHQLFTVRKTVQLKESGVKHILYAHMSRSGKTYMMRGSIELDGGSNYLVVTTAPNETYQQYKDLFKNLGFNVTRLTPSVEPITEGRNVIITSKQFLDGKDILWLKQLNFDMVFVDEGHHGGTTDLAQGALEMYAPDTFTVFMSATPQKIKHAYDIPDAHVIHWDLEDVTLCKNINRPETFARFEEKYGGEFIDLFRTFSNHQIKTEYSQFPEMHILTQTLPDDIKSQIVSEVNGSSYGYSMTATFGLTSDKKGFQRPDEVSKLFYCLFGKHGTRIPDPVYENCFMKRIEDVCKETGSRYIGDSSDDVKVVMAFLPGDNINPISKALGHRLMNDTHLGYRRQFSEQYDIVSINSKVTSNPKQVIADAVAKARNSGKEGVLVLSGSQCHMAVSVQECDVVLLLNDRSSYEMVLQMMFRAMTEAPRKKCGFVVDMSLDRILDTVVSEYASNLTNSSLSRGEALKYLLTSKIVNINADEWVHIPGDHQKQITTIAEKLDHLYITNGHKSILKNLDRLKERNFQLTKEQELCLGLRHMRGTGKIRITGKDPIESIRDGIERKIYGDEHDVPKEKMEKRENFADILRFVVPLFSFITCRHRESSFLGMCEMIDADPDLKKICTDHISTWTFESIDNESILKNLMSIYSELGMHGDKDLNTMIGHVKELVYENRHDRHEMSKVLDDILLVHKNEKKMNAEIPTPNILREKMVDKVPESFWQNPSHKVLESSVGKIGFLNEIIDKFMNGLKGIIPDEKERYKHIVEQCLYFADKNQSNIHIVKAILDPDDVFKLNANIGDTLDMVFWNGQGVALSDNYFDLVVQNPPYNDGSGNKGAHHTLWDKFTIKAIEKWLKPGGYLVAVHPGNWRQGEDAIFDIFKEKQLHYLEIHNSNDGQKVFKCGTSFDWYLLENSPRSTKTIVVGEDGAQSEIDMGEWSFLPNMMHEYVRDLMTTDATDRLDITRDRSVYPTEKKGLVSKDQTETFCYPLINSIKKSGVIDYRYTCDNTKGGQFGRPKFIFCNGAGHYKDKTGEVGFTEWGYAIYDTPDHIDQIEIAFKNEKFKKLLDAIKIIPSQKCNVKVMKQFKKDFWRHLISD
jgi:hypothetical protein